ncbi:serine/threonine protein kinase [Micromonospora palomenae]|uniref:non-specific serine/threonine protein kinase n=1 Tax=Micromonospora palomenae TaxID=1461247 RepID=A0A561WY35_9ACTN|nr:serine/threonine-protein kinase [Micromonospora palomenae]TWG28769.1 serine/threonine protein kinase [Micromonospora palomenae]
MSTPAWIGSYRIERLLGTGSFATVWLGHDPVLDSRVAIKVLAENWSHDLRVRERFLDEARLLRRLDHPRLVRVHGVGELPDGRPYAVLAWADGGSLRDRLGTGPLPAADALALLGEIAAGVAVLHRHRVVHRDLTPGNILFASGPTGERVLIADLGLAKALAAASGLTARAGTPGYMAPEQDDPLAVVDTRSDVFGLGRLGLRLLGDPDGAPGPTPRWRQGVPAAVPSVLHRATALRPADRYPDADAFRAALRRATSPADGDADDGHPSGLGSHGGRRADRAAGAEHGADRATGTGHPADRGRSAGHRTYPPLAGSAAPAARRGRGPARRFGLAGAGALTLVALGALAGDGGLPHPDGSRGTSGPLSVALPAGWRATGTGWAGQYDDDGRLEPALIVAADPGRWAADPDVPGAFVGLSASAARRTTPEGFVAERPHADCVAAPVRRTRQAGVDWVVARYACPAGRPVLVEAAGLAAGRDALLYVQVAPPPGGGTDFVDALLAGVRVRATGD